MMTLFSGDAASSTLATKGGNRSKWLGLYMKWGRCFAASGWRRCHGDEEGGGDWMDHYVMIVDIYRKDGGQRVLSGIGPFHLCDLGFPMDDDDNDDDDEEERVVDMILLQEGSTLRKWDGAQRRGKPFLVSLLHGRMMVEVMLIKRGNKMAVWYSADTAMEYVGNNVIITKTERTVIGRNGIQFRIGKKGSRVNDHQPHVIIKDH